MGAAGDYAKLQTIVAAYRQKLNGCSEQIFQQSPPEGGWSFSEVYFHIFDASILTLGTISDCIDGKGEERSTPLVSKLILFFNVLPPGRKYKAPRRLAERLKKISKAEAQDLIDLFSSKLETVYKNLKTADKNLKTPHPRLGYLNATQWFRFMEIHLNHHLKQVSRIEKSF